MLLKNAKVSKTISENKSPHHLQGGPHLHLKIPWGVSLGVTVNLFIHLGCAGSGTLKPQNLVKGDFLCFRKVIPIWVFKRTNKKHFWNVKGVFFVAVFQETTEMFEMFSVFFTLPNLWGNGHGTGGWGAVRCVGKACDDGGWCLGKSWEISSLIQRRAPLDLVGVFNVIH